jgi:hypothetical protein
MWGSRVGIVVSFVFLACVGDNPSANADPDGGAGSSSGSSGTPQCAGDTPEACGPACERCAAPANGRATCSAGACGKACDGAELCGDVCAVLATSADHCGRCGRSCLGGTCLGSKCQPFPLVTGLTSTHAIDVAADALLVSTGTLVGRCPLPAGCATAAPTAVSSGYLGLTEAVFAGTADVYWTAGSQANTDLFRVYRCPLSGCPTTPTAIQSVVLDVSKLAASAAHVAWSRGRDVYACAHPGCSSSTDYQIVSNTTAITGPYAMAIGANDLFYGDATAGVAALKRCALDGALCAAPAQVTQSYMTAAVALGYHAGIVYGAFKGNDNQAGDGRVWSVAATGGPIVPVATDVGGISDLAVDASGVYWTNAATGALYTCPLAGCPQPTPLVTGQAAGTMKRVRVDASAVYWMTDNAVYRLAK